ncbi:MAG: hypothetical protein PHR29_03255 [Acholeplasmataceae bacterium]|nr:hypothetical protein [Acholeplasmataceae bacterium]
MEFSDTLKQLWHSSYANAQSDSKVHVFVGNSRHISVSPFYNARCDYGYEEEKALLQGKLRKINSNLFKNFHLLCFMDLVTIPRFKTGKVIIINEYGDFVNNCHVRNIQRIINANPLTVFRVKTKQDVELRGNNVRMIKK